MREVPRKPVERTRHSHRLDRPLRRRRALRRARRRASQLQPASDVVVRMRRPPRRLRRLLSRRLAARARAHPLPRPNACVRAKPFPADRARPRRQRHPPMQRHPAQPRDYAAVSVSEHATGSAITSTTPPAGGPILASRGGSILGSGEGSRGAAAREQTAAATVAGPSPLTRGSRRPRDGVCRSNRSRPPLQGGAGDAIQLA